MTELAEFQKENQIIFNVGNSLPENVNRLKTDVFEILTTFGSTYTCEQIFSNMYFITNKLKSQKN